MGDQRSNSTHRRVPARALREIQPPAEICGSVNSIDRKKMELWKEELDEELENHRRILGRSKSTVPPNGIKIRNDVVASSNQSSIKGKRFEAPSSPEKVSSTSDRERRWKEELDQELEMLRSCMRKGKQPSAVCTPPKASSKSKWCGEEEMAAERSSGEEQWRKWKEELEQEMQIKREALGRQSGGLRRKH